jgi:hypothetical protein
MAKKTEPRRTRAVRDDEGGAGSGTPGGGTDMRTNGRYSGGNVQKDKEKLFPELARKKKRSSAKPTQGKREAR